MGTDLTIEEGYASARQVGLCLLATLQNALGSLDRVKRIVKVVGFVNSDPSFTEQPSVVNGVSDLLVDVFGDNGRHARSAVGMVQLPGSIPVEVELVIEIESHANEEARAIVLPRPYTSGRWVVGNADLRSVSF